MSSRQKRLGPKARAPVALDDPVDAADVVGLQDDGRRRRAVVEPAPDGVGPGFRDERVDDDDLAA